MTLTSIAANEKFHLLDSTDDIWISTRSLWRDNVWTLDNETYGVPQTDARLNWVVKMPDGSYLTDHEWKPLLESFKKLAWSLFSDAREGLPLKPGSVSILAISIRYLAYWMAYRGYVSFKELDRNAADLFLDDLTEHIFDQSQSLDSISEGDINETTSFLRVAATNGGINNRLVIWKYLWYQREALIDAGVESIPEIPFDIPISKIAEQLSQRSIVKIPPLPDEVAIPIINAATRLIFTPADDVMFLQEIYLSLISDNNPVNHPTSGIKMSVYNSALEEFIFSIVPGEKEPWRQKIEPEVFQKVRDVRNNYHREFVPIDPLQQLRQLLYEIRDACSIVIQAQAGVRISELCSLRSGWNSVIGLPSCITIRKSKTGLNEHFYLEGKISKTVRIPLKVEWLLGSRPLGSDLIPAPVRAVIVLELLFDYWRKLAIRQSAKESLFITFTSRRGLAKQGKTISSATSNMLSDGQNILIRKYIDLSILPEKNKKGEDLTRYRNLDAICIRTHQWRKTYAHFVFKTDSRMIPAIAQQFQHLSLAMTEQGYISNDPELLESLSSARKESTVAFFYRYVTEKPLLAGRLSKLIDQHRSELDSLVDGLKPNVARHEISKWIEAKDLKIFFSTHGKCFIRASPADARCHQIAGSSSWNNREPNYLTREPGVCLGCSCFVVDDEHLEFWKKRYIENKHAFDSLGAEQGRVFKERVTQSEAVLAAFNLQCDDLE